MQEYLDKYPYLLPILVFFWYLIIIYILSIPVKKIFKKILAKTDTDIDDKIFEKTWTWIKILVFLVWFNLIYFLYLEQLGLNWITLGYKLIISLEIICIWIISFKIFKILRDYFIEKFKNILSPNGINMLKLLLDLLLGLILVILILNTWWVNIAPLLASAGILWLAVALASKEIISNFLSGIILFLDKSINVWDLVVLADGTSAKIQEINVRTTHFRKADGVIVILPNSVFLNKQIENKSIPKKSKTRRVEVAVGVSYWSDLKKARELLTEYLKEVDWAKEETINIYLDMMWDWSLNIIARVEVPATKYDFMSAKHILEKVYVEFPKNGLEFPFPTYNIVKKGS